MTRIDLNSDLGESFGRYTIGNDDQVLDLITAANVACGFHAGDPDVMAQTVALAEAKGVAIGAHPGFPDLGGLWPPQVRHDARRGQKHGDLPSQRLNGLYQGPPPPPR